MRWFRANKTFGSRLALFALAVQFVVAFGHIHRDDIYGSARPAAAIAAAAPDGAQPLPANHPSKHGDDYCAICAAVSLLGNSFVAAAPALPLPSASYAIEQFDRVAVIFIAPRRAAFQSRAPPAA
ncbi:MAG TPA: hypothetical protein VGM09_29675 [Bradyrhizobium sp.]|jgi:hypothetical protein